MPPAIGKILCAMILSTLLLGEMHAQSKAVGSSFSYAGIGLVYEHDVDENSFSCIRLRIETPALFNDGDKRPGISASFSWNMIFADIQSRSGNKIALYAGPGTAVGMTGDLTRDTGLMFGLMGTIGGECTFSRNVTVSMSISPVIGLHLGAGDGMLNMLLYKTGLLYGIMPEVGIKYTF